MSAPAPSPSASGFANAPVFDLLIVGGGVTGASIAWDASLRGLKVALVEKLDFSHATTSASSKLIHGGLRYLQNFELGLVRESLRERRLWEKNAPHMVAPLPFIVPTRGKGLKSTAALKLGLTLYDWLAYDRNRLSDPDKHIPGHRRLSRGEAIAMEPGLASTHLTGAMMYHDCQMWAPERLSLELILGAADRGSQVSNYTEVTEFLRDGNRVLGAKVRDNRPGSGGTVKEVRAHVTINAAGPWADTLMGTLQGGKSSRRLIRSKGIHVITRALTQQHAIAVLGRGGHFFLLPWRGHTIIGTTDTVFEGAPDDFTVTERDIAQFLAIVNDGYPAAALRREDVIHFYGGMRPLVEEQTAVQVGQIAGHNADETDSYAASRAAEILDHEAEEGLKGAMSAIGGKWTTSRHLAEKVVDRVVAKLGRVAPACQTEDTPTPGGAEIERWSAFQEDSVNRFGQLFGEAETRYLARQYGSQLERVAALAKIDSRLGERISENRDEPAATVAWAVREEMAVTLGDVLFRRTGLGTLGHPGNDALRRTAELMARELGWDAEETRQQIAAVEPLFVPAP
jgi:glycerol-3-phosphate dehydrogenase